MFRRHWSGLPKDVSFPTTLQELGYFINDQDEIRSIQDPDFYFKYFLNRNERINERQRFSFNYAMEKVIHARLEKQGLQKIRLPLGTPPSKPHVPIFASTDITSKRRVVLIFGEERKDLGLIAGRVANGPGGVEKGSMVSVVRALQSQTHDGEAPGVILANMGQLYWWPEGQRAITLGAKNALPLASLVHTGRKYVPALNDIPGHTSPDQHARYIFNEVLSGTLAEGAMLEIVTVGGGSCEIVQRFLDEEWGVWAVKVSCLVLIETICTVDMFCNAGFKEFLAKRSRCYTISSEPLNTALSPPTGNPALSFPLFGTPIYSSSEPHHTECILIHALQPIMAYLHHMALNPDAENEPIEVEKPPTPEPVKDEVMEDKEWDKIKPEEKPMVGKINPEWMVEEIKNLRLWNQFKDVGQATKDDAEKALQVARGLEQEKFEVEESKPSGWDAV